VDDLTTIEADTVRTLAPATAQLGRDGSQLRGDLAVARALETPSDPVLGGRWLATLRQLADGQAALDKAAAEPSAALIAQAHERLAEAGNGLLAIGQDIQAGI
jgi:hypothetical protein